MKEGREEIIAAVVVTYNRKDCLKKNIECLLRQTRRPERIYVIDNASTDGTENIVREFQEKEIRYVRMSENMGGSGGFSTGVRRAYQEGADAIWGMDDDAYPKENALQKLLDIHQRMGNQVCLWSNCNGDSDFKGEHKIVSDWMFVGFFVTRQVIEKVGFPRDDMFIYYDDSEYAGRIQECGFPIRKVRDSVIDHQDAPSKCYGTIKLGKKTIRVMAMPNQPWRLYYLIRNRIYLNRKPLKKKIKTLFGPVLRGFFKVLIFQPRNLPVFFKAVSHGIRGKLGKVMVP